MDHGITEHLTQGHLLQIIVTNIKKANITVQPVLPLSNLALFPNLQMLQIIKY